MSDVNSIMGSNEAYYDPSKDVPSIVPEGMFKAYATKLSEREVIVRDKYVADVFDIEFELAEDNKGESVEIDGKAVDKGGYAGKTVRSKGFFRFKKPDPSNSLTAHAHLRYVNLPFFSAFLETSTLSSFSNTLFN